MFRNIRSTSLNHLHILSRDFPRHGTRTEDLDGNLVQSDHHGGLNRLIGVQTLSFESGFNCNEVWQRCQDMLRQKLTDVQSGVAGSILMIAHTCSDDILSHKEDPFGEHPHSR